MKQVGIHCTAIPDGVHDGRCRLSIVLTPDTRARDFDLGNWPKEIASQGDKLRVGRLISGGTTLEPIEVNFDSAVAGIAISELETDRGTSNALWKRIFKANGDINALWNALNHDQTATQNLLSSNMNIALSVQTNPALLDVDFGHFTVRGSDSNWLQTAFLGEVIETFHDELSLVRMLALLVAQEMGAAAIRAQVPLFDPATFLSELASADHSSFAINNAEFVNAVASAFVQRPFRQTHLAALQRRVLHRMHEAGLGVDHGDAFGALSYFSGKARQATVAGKSALRDHQLEVLIKALERLRLGEPEAAEIGRVEPEVGAGRREMLNLLQKALTEIDDSKLAAQQLQFTDLQNTRSAIQSFHTHWTNSPVGVEEFRKANPLHNAEEEDLARRKFFGIRAQPTLAKFLRLIVDVDFQPPGEEREVGAIAAWFDTGTMIPHDRLDFTAYEYSKQKNRKIFRPRSLEGGDFIPIKNGVVNLQAVGRFKLSTVDLASSLNAMRAKEESEAGAQRDGTLRDSISTKTLEQSARGIQLVDRYAGAHMVAGLANGRAILLNDRRLGSRDNALHAEHLAIGFRPYVKRYPFGKPAASARSWLSLVARNVIYGDIPIRVIESKTYARYRDRDHGLVRQANKIIPKGSNLGTPSTDEQLFAWMGTSLALSTETQGKKEADSGNPPGSEKDLPVSTEYKFAVGHDHMLPALRIGDSYLIGLVPVYPNGGGPSREELMEAFDNDVEAVVLGDPDARGSLVPFRFGPPRDVPAPMMLVSDIDAQAWRKREQSKTRPPIERGYAEHVERIVLRTSDSTTSSKESAVRYLVPPRTTFERAEQSGMFDTVFEETPAGAFGQYDLDPETGSFVSDNHTPLGGNAPALPLDERARPALLRLLASPRKTASNYYPDPLARKVFFKFERAGSVPTGFPEQIPYREFWKKGALAVSARPVELLIKRWATGKDGALIDFKDTKAIVKGSGGASQVVERLAVALAPAEQVNLRIWSLPDLSDILKSRRDLALHMNLIGRAIARQVVNGGKGWRDSDKPITDYIEALARGEEPEKILSAMGLSGKPEFVRDVDKVFDRIMSGLLLQTPENGLNAWLTLELVHAVQKPLAVPSIGEILRPRSIGGELRKVPVLALNGVRLPLKTGWGSFAAALDAAHSEEALDLKSQPEGSTTYFVGQIDFDRASTGELRIEASWPDLNPSLAIVQLNNEKISQNSPMFAYRPPRQDRELFSVTIPRERGGNPDGKLDLTFNEAGLLRGLNYAFADTAARELSLRLVATSRFVGDFPDLDQGEPKPPKGGLGHFEVESRPPTGSHRASADVVHRNYKLLLPATTPPPQVNIGRVEWVMPERLIGFERGRRVCADKQCYPRLYLGRDWYASGEHELFAIVCAPGDYVSDRAYTPDTPISPLLDPVALSSEEQRRAKAQRNIQASEFLDPGRFKAIADSVTRWGVDPTIRSGELTGTITRERFSGFVAAYSDLAHPANSSQKVAVLLYKPKFDVFCGEFYVDIGIDTGPAYAPFVRLAVARYQPYVCDAAQHLSGITMLKPLQVMPKRTVEIIIGNDGMLRTIVQGVGYTERALDMPTHYDDPAYPQLSYPLQNVQVLHLGPKGTNGGVQVFDQRGEPVCEGLVAPQFFHPELVWISELRLPSSLKDRRYAVQIEEVDLFFDDETFDSPDHDGVRTVERPANFSLTLDIDRGLFTPEEPVVASM